MLHNESYEGEIFIKMCISSLGKLLKEMGELVNTISILHLITGINFDIFRYCRIIKMCGGQISVGRLNSASL